MNYDANNNTYMEALEGCCTELEEVNLRCTDVHARLDDEDTLVVEL